MPQSQELNMTAYPQSFQPVAPPLSRDKPQWISYDESDPETQYGFQRKKRFGVKNGSEAVKQCIEWVSPRTKRNGGVDASDSDEEGYQRSRIRPTQQLTGKIGTGDTSFEVQQLKKAMAMQQAALRLSEELIRKVQLKEQQQKAHPNRPMTAWQQIPLGQMLDGDTGAPRNQQNNINPSTTPPPGPGKQNEAVQVNSLITTVTVGTGMPPQNSARFHPDTTEPSSRKPTGFALPLADLAAMTRDEPVVSARLSARASARKDRASQDFHDPARKSYSTQSATAVTGGKLESGGEGATHPPVNKQGLGNTMLGSPFDPRSLHDPSSIDPVWRKREEQRERAKRLNALLGTSSRDKPVIDEKQYAESNMKQHARRLKIKSFERRFTEQRLAHPAPGTTTRDYSETWMSVVCGKPPFAAFGNGNTAPATGGLIYGDYMLSHNVSPEKKPNRPGQKQTTDEARRVRELKRKENAKTLRRLIESGDVPDQTESGRRPSTAGQQYTANGRRIVRGSSEERSSSAGRVPMIQPSAGGSGGAAANAGIASVPINQQAGNPKNVAAGFPQPGSSPSLSSSSPGMPNGPALGRLPLERAMAWDLGNQVTNDARRSGRRQGFPDEVIGNGKNSLAETSARTMSVLPLPEPHPNH